MSIQFQKECGVCGSTAWCILSSDNWVCLGCVEDRIQFETMGDEE